MTLTGLMLDALTLFLVLAYALSAVVATVRPPQGEPSRGAREARRLLFAPPVVALVLIGAGFWPGVRAALGGAPDHCAEAIARGPHLCWLHAAGEPGGMAHDLAVIALILLLGAVASWHAFQWGQALGRLRLLDSLAVPSREAEVRTALATAGVTWPGDLTVVSFERPMCFVVGVRHPRLLISTAVLDELSAADLRVIVAHESAHLARRDNFWRLAGHLAMLFHLPGLGRHTFQRWVIAAEVACDDVAARAMGSRLEVAEALVHFQRLAQQRGTARAYGAAFWGDDALETRVHLLLDPPAPSVRHRLASAWPWLALPFVAWQADPIHAGLESLLHLLHW